MPMSPRLLRPRASGFNPKNIANLGMWLDAADAASYTQSSGQVTDWLDKSGNGRHFAQSTANNRPTLFESSIDTQGATAALINGKQALYFDGVNDVLSGNNSSLDVRRNVSGMTVFVVAKEDAVPGGQGLFSVSTSGGNPGLFVNYAWPVGGRRLDADSTLSFPAQATNGSISNSFPPEYGYFGRFLLERVSIQSPPNQQPLNNSTLQFFVAGNGFGVSNSDFFGSGVAVFRLVPKYRRFTTFSLNTGLGPNTAALQQAGVTLQSPGTWTGSVPYEVITYTLNSNGDEFNSRFTLTHSDSLALLRSRFDYANATLTLTKNGYQVASTTFQTAGNTSDTNATFVKVGEHSSGYFKGNLGEILVYRRALSNTESAAVESYLYKKWGVLPA